MRVADWTPDRQAVIVSNIDSGALELMDASNGQRRVFLRMKNNAPVEMASLSPDGSSIAVLAEKLFVGAFSVDGVLDSSSLQLLADSARETIHWSPDGKALYFISDVEGPACLWAVCLSKPGNPQPVLHFHERRRALLGSFALAADRIYLGIHETKGNLWVGKLGR